MLSAWQAHPRVSGENPQRMLRKRLSGGSSPRERGKLSQVPADFGAVGLIPA